MRPFSDNHPVRPLRTEHGQETEIRGAFQCHASCLLAFTTIVSLPASVHPNRRVVPHHKSKSPYYQVVVTPTVRSQNIPGTGRETTNDRTDFNTDCDCTNSVLIVHLHGQDTESHGAFQISHIVRVSRDRVSSRRGTDWPIVGWASR